MFTTGVSIKLASSDFNISALTALSPAPSANEILNKVEYSLPLGKACLPRPRSGPGPAGRGGREGFKRRR